MKTLKKEFEKTKRDVVYSNDFIDDVILSYDKRMIIIFFYIIYKLQSDSKMIEINKKDLKKIFSERISDAKLSKYIKNILKTTVYYRSDKNIFENGKLFAKKNDYIEELIFDKLAFWIGDETIKFLLKEKYRKMFSEIKENFSKHSIEDLENMSKISILIFLQLNRWKNYGKEIYMNFEYFRLNTELGEGYRQMDIVRKLENSIAEIKKYTGLEIKYQIRRSLNGRKIEELIFSVKNSKEHYQQTLFDDYSNPIKKKIAKWVLKNQYGEIYEEEDDEW